MATIEQLAEREGINLIVSTSPSLIEALKFLEYASPDKAEEIAYKNFVNLQRFISRDNSDRIDLYFEIPGKAIGAIKFNPEAITTREKREDGLHLIPVPPYLEIGSISVLPEFRRQGLSKKFYNLFLEIFQATSAERLCPYLLIGAVGNLKTFYNELYSRGEYNKDSVFIPRDVFGDRWNLVGTARSDSRGTESCCRKLGIPIIGSSRSSGGPIFYDEVAKLYGKKV